MASAAITVNRTIEKEKGYQLTTPKKTLTRKPLALTRVLHVHVLLQIVRDLLVGVHAVPRVDLVEDDST